MLAKELRMLETQKFETTAFFNANDIPIEKMTIPKEKQECVALPFAYQTIVTFGANTAMLMVETMAKSVI